MICSAILMILAGGLTSFTFWLAGLANGREDA